MRSSRQIAKARTIPRNHSRTTPPRETAQPSARAFAARPGDPAHEAAKSRAERMARAASDSVTAARTPLTESGPKAARKPDLWQNVPILKSCDIALLRPPSLPRGKRFETLADAARIDEARIARLLSSRPDLAAEIEQREEDGRLVPSPISARDARRYRRYDTAERLRIAKEYEGLHEIATIYLRAFLAGQLHAADLKLAQAALRKTLQRAGFKGSILIGGTEVAWLAKDGLWILHCHLLAIGVPGDAWDRLREVLPDARPAASLKVQALEDFAKQLSYCQKFNSSHMPGKRRPNGRARAYPLPAERLAEWAAWVAKYRFEDFGFLFGARRRGGRIVPEV